MARSLTPRGDIDIKDINDARIPEPIDGLPEGWSVDHEEYTRVDSGSVGATGHYLYQYESEHFLVYREVDTVGGTRCHHVVLMKIGRDDDGSRTTVLGTGVFEDISLNADDPAFMELDADPDHQQYDEAQRQAERAAFQVALDMMQKVNEGKYDHLRY
jgi:hypothetical protein